MDMRNACAVICFHQELDQEKYSGRSCIWLLCVGIAPAHAHSSCSMHLLSCAYVAKTPQTTSGLRLCLYRIVQACNAQRGIAELFPLQRVWHWPLSIKYTQLSIVSKLSISAGNFSGSAKFTSFGIRLLLFSHGSRLPLFSASVVQRRVREFRTRAWSVLESLSKSAAELSDLTKSGGTSE
eukprot:s1269_g18.t1